MRSSTLIRGGGGGGRGQHQGEYPHACKQQQQLLLLWGITGKSGIPEKQNFFQSTVRVQKKLLYLSKRFTHGMRPSPADLSSVYTHVSRYARS